MKTLLSFLVTLCVATVAHAASQTSSRLATRPVPITGSSYDLSFRVTWWCDDYPQSSAPGRIELLAPNGISVGRVIASHYLNSGASVSAFDNGSVGDVTTAVARFTTSGTPADGFLAGTWHLTGLIPGTYTLRLWSYTTNDTVLRGTTVWTDTYFEGGSSPLPPPAQYALIALAGAGGTVSPGGNFNAGTTAIVSATADPGHDFTGWSGDAEGAANPLAVLMDRAKTVQANFSLKNFTLTTAASAGGSVTAGGLYAYGTTVTITATADATHRFTGWSGDASGNELTIAVTVTRPLLVEALFEAKIAQTITFAPLTDQSVGTSIPLTITASSGLPVSVFVNGPATFTNGTLTITAPGAVSIQATQSGDDDYLPATPVTRSFNATGSAVLKYRAPARTLFQASGVPASSPYVIQPNP